MCCGSCDDGRLEVGIEIELVKAVIDSLQIKLAQNQFEFQWDIGHEKVHQGIKRGYRYWRRDTLLQVIYIYIAAHTYNKHTIWIREA